MTNPTNSSEQAPAPTETPKDPGELSYPEYEKLRRGGPASESTPNSALEANPSEQKQVATSDPAKAAEEKEEETKDELEDDEEASASDKSESVDKDKPKKKGGFQRRIDKLNAAKADAQREAEYWKEQALKGAGANQEKPKVEEPKTVDPAGKPDPEKYETHAEYVEALTDWKIAQREKTQETKAQQKSLAEEQNKAAIAHAERTKAFMEKTEDFMEVIEALDDVQVSPAVAEVITASENGPALLYELAKNKEEALRICKLSPLAAARELGKLESKIIDANSSASKKTESKKTITQAPKPIEPVGSGKGHVAKSLDDPNLSFADYERLRRAQMKRRA